MVDPQKTVHEENTYSHAITGKLFVGPVKILRISFD